MIADPHPLFSEALSIALGAEPDFQVLEDRPLTGTAAVRTAGGGGDVALVDYWLPDLNGAVVAQQICQAAPGCHVIVFAWLYGPAQVQASLEAGASGFLPKSIGVLQLCKAIRQAAAGRNVQLKELSNMLDRVEQRRQRAGQLAMRLRALTPRELEVVQMLGEGLSVHDVAKRLFIAPGTAKGHIHKILKKTGAASSNEVVAVARFLGLLRK